MEENKLENEIIELEEVSVPEKPKKSVKHNKKDSNTTKPVNETI